MNIEKKKFTRRISIQTLLSVIFPLKLNDHVIGWALKWRELAERKVSCLFVFDFNCFVLNWADKESNWAIQRINKQETNLQKNNINILPCKYQALVIFLTKFISEIN